MREALPAAAMTALEIPTFVLMRGAFYCWYCGVARGSKAQLVAKYGDIETRALG
jgi:hypothetical protein